MGGKGNGRQGQSFCLRGFSRNFYVLQLHGWRCITGGWLNQIRAAALPLRWKWNFARVSCALACALQDAQELLENLSILQRSKYPQLDVAC